MIEINIGAKYGKWLVLEEVYNDKYKRWFCKCECQCDFKTISIVRKRDLFKGKTTKCNKCSSNTFIEHETFYEGITRKGESFYFDKEDYDVASCHTWCIRRGYAVCRANKSELRLHRAIMMKYNKNMIYSDYVDHINKNKADNRKSNLRICNSSVNQENRKIQKKYHWL